MSLNDQTKKKMELVIDHLKKELQAIRTGRASPALLDGISVEIYGSPMRLKDIAQVAAPEPRLLQVSPFDARNAAAISNAIEKANLGLRPRVDGNVIRISIPPMDDAMRKEMIKLCHKKCEEAKVGVRNERRHANDTAKREKKEGTLAEDVFNKLEKNIQEFTDKFCKEADELAARKEKEISTI